MSTWGRLHAATLELTKSSSQKQRLTAAFDLHLKDLEALELPAELRDRFLAVAAELQAVKPLPGETAAHATIRKMSADQVERCALQIVEICHEYVHAAEGVTRLPVRDKREEPIPLLFAAEA